ncbi:hypothetical protein AKJ66_00060 [candidate division MSBL1 archaeon SCGC-AAA259E22]|uniref:Uncharacterized protein n=1 Tax=candidate division MSBL1 archaeon SCGC-AAA259E22 TaxID=1698265 RepID=A0A133UIH7_9EURY|nr:hypothetical protein AKJ66_00060 [candidate division MSBL1 archaeon SCGC-AAA259E22]
MKEMTIFGKKIPAWILVASFVVAGAGAAAGTVLQGQITGKAPVTVSQALVLPTNPTVSGANAQIVTKSDDDTAFQAAAEVNNGQDYEIDIPVKNKADEWLALELTLDASGPVQIGSITKNSNLASNKTADKAIRISEDTWKCNINSDSTEHYGFKVALPDDAQPGFYKIEGKIEAVNY